MSGTRRPAIFDAFCASSFMRSGLHRQQLRVVSAVRHAAIRVIHDRVAFRGLSQTQVWERVHARCRNIRYTPHVQLKIGRATLLLRAPSFRVFLTPGHGDRSLDTSALSHLRVILARGRVDHRHQAVHHVVSGDALAVEVPRLAVELQLEVLRLQVRRLPNDGS